MLWVSTVSCYGKGKEILSPIISTVAGGKLAYDTDESGDRVPDFSRCGYFSGDMPLPTVPVRVVVTAVKGDSTIRIQKAIDHVSKMAMDTNGFRGAVLLKTGRHDVSGGLVIRNSGVVLMGENGTVLMATGKDRRTLIRIFGKNDLETKTASNLEIQDARVPVGAVQFHVGNDSHIGAGSSIRIVRPSTKEWIDKLGMGEFGGGIADWRLVWKPASRDIIWERTVTSFSNGLVTIDAPITTAIDQTYGKGYVETFSWPGRIQNVGIQNLHLDTETSLENAKDEEHSWMAVSMENIQNAWVRNVTVTHFAGSAVAIYENCRAVTVQDCISSDPVSEDAGYRRNTYFTMGQQCLFLRCISENGRHDFGVGHCAAGPNVFVQCESSFSHGDSGAIESWASGTLFDNVRIDGAGLSLGNRGADGQGAGWAAANSMLWQCSASMIRCENPPTAKNWAFGCWGEFVGDGIWRKSNESVRPISLFAAQISDRLGQQAAPKILTRGSAESDPKPDQMPQILADSSHAAPSLKDFIILLKGQNEYRPDLASASDVDALPDAETKIRPVPRKITLTNGWLVCDGKLLVGQSMSLRWWQGNIRPSEATKFGERLTRYVPGRIGEGFTDELDSIADKMFMNGQVMLDHHYGLWYDRRREDHERIRRIDGAVWPPFYEQPFARSGQGVAWDGLSRYDLTKYNPWYWGRLKEFADICGERGFILMNENYFQHNVLEAGAHWVDSPWRTANNINATGFPEPPPFVGDKRIFMAPIFYDLDSNVRKNLHRAYIRQNLENFRNQPNVIQFTSGEYSGPLEFMQFWLDTANEWKHETGVNELVALSAPKDVQDSILADPKRSDEVDVICFRYWWITDKGLYSPKGGKNLAPRQSLRQWKGGMPNDKNLAAMAAEYRAKFPAKAIIAQSEDNDLHQAGWQYLCAGGSIPNIPITTDHALLEVIPRMAPVSIISKNNGYALSEKGKNYLIYVDKSEEATIDLTGESGGFILQTVDNSTGLVHEAKNRFVSAGKIIKAKEIFGAGGVFWLSRAE
jgi:hypothetical protein